MLYDLYFLRGSPWSARVLWAFSFFSEETKKKINLHEPAGADSMFSTANAAKPFDAERGNKYNQATLPMMFITQENGEKIVVREGINIVFLLCEMEKNDFSMMTLEKKDEIFNGLEELEIVMKFFRAMMISNSQESVAQFVAPKWMRYIPGAFRFIDYFSMKRFRQKYVSDTELGTQEEAEKVLEKYNEKMKSSKYVLGEKMTYLDLILCLTIENFHAVQINPALTFVGLTPKTVEVVMQKLNWKGKFGALIEFYKRFHRDHFSKEMIELCCVRN